jgi:hypothetical protein
MADRGLAYLEKNTDDRLGGKCLIGLAFHKRGMPNTHLRIVEAVQACRSEVEKEKINPLIYSKAIAIIFLTEIDANAHKDLIHTYVEMLPSHQKDGGGYGYWQLQTGDTSQTQYTALAYWELLNHGMSPDASAVQKCLGWLMRTQDPSGVWGYQGQDPGTASLTQQTDRAGPSMGAAGLAATMILGNAVGLLTPVKGEEIADDSQLAPLTTNVPPALQRVEDKNKMAQRAPALPAGNINPQQLSECIRRGRAWWDKNFTYNVDEYQLYYIYSIERLKSFDAYLHGGEEAEPDWYNKGVEYLKKTQLPEGCWRDACGDQCATSFAVLFLLRSTQQSIKASLGEGTLVGGRGLPRDLSKVRLRGGKLVVQQNTTELDQLLNMMEDNESGDFEGLIDNPAALAVGEVTPEAARRLQQIVRSGGPQSRLLAVRALSKARKLDYAPTLIFALTDPDHAVVREARDALRFLSRNFEGYGPPDNFDDAQRDQAIIKWKQWYMAMRPDSPPLP